MKKLPFTLLLTMMLAVISVSCRYARQEPLGDTVAASVFEPREEVAVQAQADTLDATQSVAQDSVGLYFIGDGSTRTQLQLVSYPSCRDTVVRGKTAHVKVTGSAAYGAVVRVKYYVLPSGDSLVSHVEQVKMEQESKSE